MRPGQLPDRPPRKRERPRWPKLLLIAGITLTVAGFVLTFGPLTIDLGGTDAPSLDEPAGDSPGVDAADKGDETGDETTGSDGIDESGNDSIRGMIGGLTAGDDTSGREDDDGTRERCVVE